MEIKESAVPQNRILNKWHSMSEGPDVGRWITAMVKEGFMGEVADRDICFYTRHKSVPKPGSSKKRIVGVFNALNDISVANLGLSKEPLALCKIAANWKFKVKLDLLSGTVNPEGAPEQPPLSRACAQRQKLSIC